MSIAELFVQSLYQKYPRPRKRKSRPPRRLAYNRHGFHWGQRDMLNRELKFYGAITSDGICAEGFHERGIELALSRIKKGICWCSLVGKSSSSAMPNKISECAYL